MNYNPNMPAIVATYADGGIVSSVVRPEFNREIEYHYLCVFETDACARRFMQKNLHDSAMLTVKTMGQLVREFNSSLVWTGMLGIAYVYDNDDVEHVDSDKLIKMAYKDLSPKNKSYGKALMSNGKLNDVAEIDFNKKYFLLVNTNGNVMTERTYNENGKYKSWVVVTTSRKALIQKADDFKIKKQNRRVEKDTLSGLLGCFVSGYEFSHYAGIIYIDDSGETRLTKKQIVNILAKRRKAIVELAEEIDIFLDEKYFVALDRECGSIIMSKSGKEEYILVSQRMDVMLKTLELEGINLDELFFTNLMSLREIMTDGSECDYDGVAICIDDNPDHVAYLTESELYDIAHDGAEDDSQQYVIGNDAFMLTPRYVLMSDGEYVMTTIQSPEVEGEELRVILMADTEDILMDSLEQTDYPFTDEEAVALPTYEIFSEFRDGALFDCDAIMCFDGEDGFYMAPKFAVMDTLQRWEASTKHKSVKVDLDYEERYYVAIENGRALVFPHTNGDSYVLVSKNKEFITKAMGAVFKDVPELTFTDEYTLADIITSAVADEMGMGICEDGAITFIGKESLAQIFKDDL